MTTAGAQAKAWLAEARVWADDVLERVARTVDLGPPALAEPLRYALFGGGKRVRPALCRLVGEALGAPLGSLQAGAFALECIHTYSLVHDDLPCMDDDDLRRGRPTVHRAWDEATAVLVGDALQALAFEVLARDFGPRAAEAVAVLARASGAGGMVGGQVLDLRSEGADEVRLVDVEAIHATKTAALLGAAAELGALAAGQRGRDDARAFGQHVGRTFQAMDDVLDVTGDASTLGKTPGKDAEVQKGTLVAALGLDGARAAAARHAEAARAAAERLGLGALGAGLVDTLLERNS